MDRPADSIVYRIVHRAMVAGAERLAGAVGQADVSHRGRRLDALVRWASGFTAELRWHQAEEDVHAFPALVERVPAAAAIVARLETDHRDLAGLLDELAPALAALAATSVPFDEAQRRAAATAGLLSDLVAAHVFDEDVNVAPLIERHLSYEDFAAEQRAAARRLPLRDAAFTISVAAGGSNTRRTRPAARPAAEAGESRRPRR